MANETPIIIYTDGACRGNPGPGGWGALLQAGPHEKALCGGEAHTTNNRMELTAVIRALQADLAACGALFWAGAGCDQPTVMVLLAVSVAPWSSFQNMVSSPLWRALKVNSM